MRPGVEIYILQPFLGQCASPVPELPTLTSLSINKYDRS